MNDPLSLYTPAGPRRDPAGGYSILSINVSPVALILLTGGLVRQHDALDESRRHVVALGAVIVAAVQGRQQAPGRARRGQAFVDEAAHSVDVDVAVGRVVLDVRRVGEQHQLHSHATLGPSAGELLDVLDRFWGHAIYSRCIYSHSLSVGELARILDRSHGSLAIK